MDTQQMKIGFIGAGKVGNAFGCYLRKKNIEISGYTSRSPDSGVIASNLTQSVFFANSIELILASDLVFITTNDDQIEIVATELGSSEIDLRDKCFAHMSGALSSDRLKPLREKGAAVFSVHPMQSFADHEKSILDLENTTFGIEGSQKIEIIISLLEKTDNPYILLTPDQKTEYHIASCIVSNFLTALLDSGFNIMKSIGIEETTAISALAPMIRGTVENIIKLGPQKALTGPIARGDLQTIKKHLLALEKNKTAAETYRSMGKLTLDLAKKEKLSDPAIIKELTELLS